MKTARQINAQNAGHAEFVPNPKPNKKPITMPTEDQKLRELDAWIAENVMGWHKYQSQIGSSKCAVCGIKLGSGAKHYHPDFHSPESGSVPFCTTDPAAAMMVLEKICEKIGAVTIVKGSNDSWWVTDGGLLGEYYPTKELGICGLAKEVFTQTKKEL